MRVRIDEVPVGHLRRALLGLLERDIGRHPRREIFDVDRRRRVLRQQHLCGRTFSGGGEDGPQAARHEVEGRGQPGTQDVRCHAPAPEAARRRMAFAQGR